MGTTRNGLGMGAALGAALVLALVGCGNSEGTRGGPSVAVDDGGPAVADTGTGLETDDGGGATAVDAGGASDPGTTVEGCEEGLAADLCFLREEEKLARDVYITLYEDTGIRVFDNISRSEQTHTNAVRDLMAARSIPDPVGDDTVGVFENGVLDGLYDDLTTAGFASDVAALTVGATIEDLDIKDIQDMADRTDDAEVLAVYESLMCGSRNHLRAFVSQLEMRGESYSPQYISTEDYEAIVGSARETCGG